MINQGYCTIESIGSSFCLAVIEKSNRLVHHGTGEEVRLSQFAVNLSSMLGKLDRAPETALKGMDRCHLFEPTSLEQSSADTLLPITRSGGQSLFGPSQPACGAQRVPIV